jgi:hypothetical protein
VFSPGIDELEVDDCCGVVTQRGIELFSEAHSDFTNLSGLQRGEPPEFPD